MPHLHRLYQALLVGLCALACGQGAGAQERVGENELKAAYVFNFIQFVVYPKRFF